MQVRIVPKVGINTLTARPFGFSSVLSSKSTWSLNLNLQTRLISAQRWQSYVKQRGSKFMKDTKPNKKNIGLMKAPPTEEEIEDSRMKAQNRIKKMQKQARQEVIDASKYLQELVQNKRLADADTHFRKMKVAKQMDVISYNIMMNNHAKQKNVKKCLELLEDMKKEGIQPNERTYTSIIQACGKAGELEKMVEFFNYMVDSKMDIDKITFTTIIAALGQVGKTDEMMNYFEIMKRKKVDPDIATFAAMISAFGKSGNSEGVFSALEQMKGYNVALNLQALTVIFDALGRIGAFQQAESYFSQLENLGLKPDQYLYNAMLAVLSRKGDVTQLLHYFEKMQRDGIKPDAEAYTSVIHAFGQKRQTLSMLEYFDKMVAAGLKPTEVTYTAMLDGFGNKGDLRSIEKFMKRMKEEGIAPNIFSYNTLIKSFLRAGYFELVLDLLKQMRAEDIQPDQITVESILAALTQATEAQKTRAASLLWKVSLTEDEEFELKRIWTKSAKVMTEKKKLFDAVKPQILLKGIPELVNPQAKHLSQQPPKQETIVDQSTVEPTQGEAAQPKREVAAFSLDANRPSYSNSSQDRPRDRISIKESPSWKNKPRRERRIPSNISYGQSHNTTDALEQYQRLKEEANDIEIKRRKKGAPEGTQEQNRGRGGYRDSREPRDQEGGFRREGKFGEKKDFKNKDFKSFSGKKYGGDTRSRFEGKSDRTDRPYREPSESNKQFKSGKFGREGKFGEKKDFKNKDFKDKKDFKNKKDFKDKKDFKNKDFNNKPGEKPNWKGNRPSNKQELEQ